MARWSGWLRWLLVRFLFLYLGAVVVMGLLETTLVYPRPSIDDGDWNATKYQVEDVFFTSADGTKLHGWYAEHANPRAFVLYCHGNGDQVAYLCNWLRPFAEEMQVSVFAFDYRGYGKSEGVPHEAGVLADGEAAQSWLAQRARIEPNEVVLYGSSLGGGVVTHLASQLGAKAVVAERTFHSMVDIAAALYRWLPVRWVMRNRYPSEKRIANYSGPWLQLHGDADRIVPIDSGRRLFDACPSDDKKLVVVPEMGHNDIAPPEFYEEVRDLLDRLGSGDSNGGVASNP